MYNILPIEFIRLAISICKLNNTIRKISTFVILYY